MKNLMKKCLDLAKQYITDKNYYWLVNLERQTHVNHPKHSIWTQNKYKPQKHLDVNVKKLLSD